MPENALLLLPQDFRRPPRWGTAAASVLAQFDLHVAVAPVPPFMRMASLLAAAPAEMEEAAARWKEAVADQEVILLSPAIALTLRARWASLFPCTWEWHEVVARHVAPQPNGHAGRLLVFKGCFAGYTSAWEDALAHVLRGGGAAEWATTSDLLCCGGKPGLQRVFPALADALLTKTVDVIRRQQPDAVLVVEPTCLDRVAAGVREAGLRMPVVHTAEWLLEKGQAS